MSGTVPLFSIITPVYNGAHYLPDLLDSIKTQTHRDYEHIIVDDGSTDDGATVSILERYANEDSRICWWTRPNQGQYATQNEAIEAATGDYILVISADDRLNNEAVLQSIADYLKQHPAYDFVYGKTAYINEANEALPDIALIWSPSTWLIKHVVYAQHCSLFVKRKFLLEHNICFDSTLHYTGDWDWLIRLFQSTDQIGYFKHFIGTIRVHSEQTSRQARRDQIDDEHHLICQRYGGNYRLHVLITWLNNYRAMALIALFTLRTSGIRAFFTRIGNWIKKRLR